MTDIAKCNGIGCNKKDTCFRYLATDSEYQSYILISDVNNCDHYWQIQNKDALKMLQREWDD